MFVGVCDKVRKTPQGEEFWQNMMATRKEISEAAFLRACDVSVVLDEGETWNQYKQAASSDPIRYYESPSDVGSIYHFQTAGFEYIWRSTDLTRTEIRVLSSLIGFPVRVNRGYVEGKKGGKWERVIGVLEAKSRLRASPAVNRV